jgi:hypothetical protein
MKPRPKPKKLPPLYKFLDKHKDSCTYWIYSGDRHCSCGRDLCLSILALARAELGDKAEQILGKVG